VREHERRGEICDAVDDIRYSPRSIVEQRPTEDYDSRRFFQRFEETIPQGLRQLSRGGDDGRVLTVLQLALDEG
jgi:hypothetical protein